MEAAGKRYVIHPSRADEFTLWFFSDIHWLSRACSEKRVIADRDRMRDDPTSLVIGGGDYAEFIGIDDLRRFDPDAVSERLTVADLGKLGKRSYEEVRDLFAPLRPRLLGMLEGNHEREYCKRFRQQDLHGWLCSELGVPNLGYSCLMDVVFVRDPKARAIRVQLDNPAGAFTRQAFRIFCHHGAGAANTKGGKINRLERFMKNVAADIYFMGHVHDQMGDRMPYLDANPACDKLVARDKLGVVSGSYLKTYSEGVTTYGEQKGYDPVSLGAAWVRIRPETREMWGRV